MLNGLKLLLPRSERACTFVSLLTASSFSSDFVRGWFLAFGFLFVPNVHTERSPNLAALIRAFTRIPS